MRIIYLILIILTIWMAYYYVPKINPTHLKLSIIITIIIIATKKFYNYIKEKLY